MATAELVALTAVLPELASLRGAARARLADRHDRLVIAVAVALLVLPFGGTKVAGMSIAFLAMAVPAVLALWRLVRDERQVPASVILLGLSAGIVTSLIAAAGGVNPASAITRVVVGFIALGYAVAVAMAYRPGLEHRAPTFLVLLAGAIAVKALTTTGSLKASTGGWVVEGRLTGPFAQPNELGIFCASMLPIAITCVVTAPSRSRRLLVSVASVAIVAAWVLSMSRGAWIGGTASLFCLAIVVPSTRRLLVRAGAAMAATCVLALVLPTTTPMLGLLGSRLRSLGNTGENEYDARPLIWGEAWRQVSARPWFGVGPDGYRIAATDSASMVSSYGADHPHDLYLTVLVERGVIGMAAGVIVLAGCAMAVRRHLRPASTVGAAQPGSGQLGSAFALAVLTGLLAVLFHGVFDMPLRNPIVYGFVWTLLGMAIVAETAPTEPTADPSLEPPTAPRGTRTP